MKRLFASIAFAFGLLGAAGAQPLIDVERPAPQQIGIDQKQGNQLPLDSEWQNSDGKTVKLGEYFGERPVVLVPVFYRCKGACILVLEGTMRLIKDMKLVDPGRDYDVVVFSFNPTETPAEAKAKKDEVIEAMKTKVRRPVDPKAMTFLTGSLDSITKLTTALGYRFSYQTRSGFINHPAGIMVITPNGKINQYFYGTEYPQRLILNSFKLAKEEKIGGKANVILFGCLMYNPMTGSYTMVTNRVLQIAGTATVLILAISIATMSIRYKYRAIEEEKE